MRRRPGTRRSVASPTRCRATQARVRAGRGRRLRRRRADQREGVPARQVRARRAAAPRTSTTTAASACRRPPRRPTGPSASTAACRSRSRTSRSADVVLLVGRQPRRDHAADHAATSTRSAERGGALIVVDPRRTATARARRPCTCSSTPGHRPARWPTASLHVLVRDGLIDEAYIAAPHRGLRGGARPGRRPTGPSGSSGSPACPQARSCEAARDCWAVRATGDGPHRPRRGAAVPGRRQRARLHQPGAGAGPAGPRRQRLRLPHRPGQRPGRPRARPEGRPAARLPHDRRPRRAAPRRAASGASTRETLPGPGQSAYELLDSLGAEGGVRALLVFGSNPVVSAPRRRPRRPSGSRALDFLVVSDFFLSETAALRRRRAAGRAVGRGGRHHDQPRGPRASARRAAVAPPAGVRTDLEILVRRSAGRLGAARALRLRRGPASVFDELRRATAGGLADYSRHHLRADRPARAACSGPARPRTIRARRGSSPSASRRRRGRARFHAVQHRGPGGGARRRVPAATSRPAACSRSTSRARRRGASAELQRDGAGAAGARCIPLLARQHGLGRRATTVPLAHAARRGELRASSSRPAIRPDTVFVPFHWGGEQAANRLDQPGARSRSAACPSSRSAPSRIETACRQAGAEDARSAEGTPGRHRQRHGRSAPRRGRPRPRRRRPFDIAMFGDEPYGNYNRILLSGVLRGSHDAEDIFINPLAWYERERRHAARRRARDRIDRPRGRHASRRTACASATTSS